MELSPSKYKSVAMFSKVARVLSKNTAFVMIDDTNQFVSYNSGTESHNLRNRVDRVEADCGVIAKGSGGLVARGGEQSYQLAS